MPSPAWRQHLSWRTSLDPHFSVPFRAHIAAPPPRPRWMAKALAPRRVRTCRSTCVFMTQYRQHFQNFDLAGGMPPFAFFRIVAVRQRARLLLSDVDHGLHIVLFPADRPNAGLSRHLPAPDRRVRTAKPRHPLPHTPPSIWSARKNAPPLRIPVRMRRIR